MQNNIGRIHFVVLSL